MRTLRIGTRGSALALAQTDLVRQALERTVPGIRMEVVPIKTAGDVLGEASLDEIGGKGVFVKDIERELMRGSIDMAVHSLKDMQALVPEGLCIGAYLPREDPRDMLFSEGFYGLKDLPPSSRVGTSSMRRRCQVLDLRPDVHIVGIRGNVNTRLGKVGSVVDAVIVAAAGVNRLGLRPGVVLSPDVMVPSPGQGIIAVEYREGDADLARLLGDIDHETTRICALTERMFLASLGQDCRMPAGALARLDGGGIHVLGMMGTPDGSKAYRLSLKGTDPSIGRDLAEMLQDRVHSHTQG